MRIALAQLDLTVGAFERNAEKIMLAYTRAESDGARLLVTPELSLCGYPPHDLLHRPEIFERCEKSIEVLKQATRGRSCALSVGHAARNPQATGRAAQNVVSVLENGQETFRQAKMLLPTYDVFDEARYFEPGTQVGLWSAAGPKVAFAVCEDLWAGEHGRRYSLDPVEKYRSLGAEIVVSASASPYEWGKQSRRQEIHVQVARGLDVPLIYVNQVGATDEILFDGGSFVVDGAGRAIASLPVFEESYWVIETDAPGGMAHSASSKLEEPKLEEIEILRRGLIEGIRAYFTRTGFKRALVGLSGGIDSAVVAALAVQALGADQVTGIAMPSQYSSSHSLEDAEALARNLKIRLEVAPIKFFFSILARELGSRVAGGLSGLTEENLQARLRGLILMTYANQWGALTLTTGNKSELAMGYCTQYGDMAGALAPIGDLFKTRVYELARHMNQRSGEVIPVRCLTKPPSAELKPNQTDQDTLPPYEVLDLVLEDYLEKGLSVEEIEKYRAGGGSAISRPGWVREILRTLERTEYKRRQAAPVLKTSCQAFGIGRRIPIAKVWDQS